MATDKVLIFLLLINIYLRNQFLIVTCVYDRIRLVFQKMNVKKEKGLFRVDPTMSFHLKTVIITHRVLLALLFIYWL